MEKQLTFPNPKAGNLADMLGISWQRQNELSKQLDKMVRTYRARNPRPVFMSETLAFIEEISENQNEFAYALVLHIQYLERREGKGVTAINITGQS